MDPAPPVELFARKIAHDLNNFATVIRTYSELLLGDLPADSGAHADVSEIHRASDAMVGYVQRMARFARAGSMRPRPTDIDRILHDAVSSLPHDDRLPAVHFDDQIGHRVDTIDTDSTWLLDAVRELLINAREAAPPTSVVRLTRTTPSQARVSDATVRDGAAVRHLVISVTDDGPGFAESVSDNAEEPFVTTKDGVRGAGFGLSIARAFARAGGGRLTRERIDGRTVVSIWLPAP